MICKRVAPKSSAMRVLLYVTTAASGQHESFMRCQADLLRRSPKLANADVLVYVGHNGSNATRQIMQGLLDNWPMPRKKLIYEPFNPGRQAGAMKALHVGFSNGWFRGYDWVIRVNPDVIFYDERRLFSLMEDPQVRGVFQNCGCPRHAGVQLTHTDFFAVRPEYVDEEAFADWQWRANNGHWAEEQATVAFKHIYRSGRWANLKPPPIFHPYFRLQDGGVWHSQSLTCERSLSKLGWERGFNRPDNLKRETRVAMEDEADDEYDAPRELRDDRCKRSWPVPGISNPSNQA